MAGHGHGLTTAVCGLLNAFIRGEASPALAVVEDREQGDVDVVGLGGESAVVLALLAA
jgi:hypothetical protein